MLWKINFRNPATALLFGGLLFLLLSFYLLVFKTGWYLIGMVGICVFICAYLLSLTSLKYAYFILAFSLPLSTKFEFDSFNTVIGLPSEMLIGLIGLSLILKWLINGFPDLEFMRHPISILILLFLIGSGIATVFSSLPIISFKAYLVRLAYIIVFYFGGYTVFKADKLGAIRLFLVYGISLLFVAIYCLYNQSIYDWNKQTAAFSVNPFYSDHTIFSACVVFVLPVFLYQLNKFIKSSTSILFPTLLIFCIGIFLYAVYFTYCRAAWISIAVALIFWVMIKVHVRMPTYLIILLFAASLFYFNWDNMLLSAKENNTISTRPETTALEQTQSITNISTDVSNAERINRWSCALRMFLDKPIVGFGPGTFQFEYLSYQLPVETTYISVFSPYNLPLGRGGSAHNEYFLLLSECGIFTFFLFVALLAVSISAALLVIQVGTTSDKALITALLLGFFSYCVHGFFNNFLDSDKAAFLFYFSLSFIALFHLSENAAKKSAHN